MISTEKPQDVLFAFGNNSSNSESVVSITAPVMDTTSKIFGWSDFPCQGQDLMSVSSSVSSFDTLDYSDDSSQEEDEVPAAPLETSASPRSSIVHNLDAFTSSASTTKKHQRKRRVSFEPVLHVRTYDVILGDHPCCVGGMALQCAWEHNPEEELVDLEMAEQHSSKRRMGQLQMNYSDRRKRLSATTGLSSCQLLQEEFKIRAARQPAKTVRSNMMKKAPTLQSLTQEA